MPVPIQDKLRGLQQEGHPAQKWRKMDEYGNSKDGIQFEYQCEYVCHTQIPPWLTTVRIDKLYLLKLYINSLILNKTRNMAGFQQFLVSFRAWLTIQHRSQGILDKGPLNGSGVLTSKNASQITKAMNKCLTITVTYGHKDKR